MMQKKKSMTRLIERLRFSNFSSPEPNPFKSLDRIKEEFGSLHLLNGISEEEEKDPELSTDADEDDDDEDEEEEENNGAAGYGILDYLTSCSIM